MMRQDSRGLLALTAALCALTCLVGGACGGGDDPATTTTSGTGGAGTGGEELGGFMAGPTGTGGGMNGGGGEGGTGEVANVWGEVRGGAGSVFPKAVAIDGMGSIVVVGAFSTGSIDLGGGDLSHSGGDDIFVVKYASNGTHLWSSSFGASGDQSALGVSVDSSGAISLTGRFVGTFSFPGGPTLDAEGNMFSDIFVAKLDTDGNHLFSARYGIGANFTDNGNAITNDGADNVIATGMFQSGANFGGGVVSGPPTGAALLATFDAQGNYLSGEGFGTSDRQEGLGVAATGSDVALVGFAKADVDFGGGVLTTDQSGQERPFVARFGAGGTHVFSRLGNGGEARAVGVAFAGQDAVVAGNFKTAIDFGDGELEAVGANDDVFVTRFDASGAQVFHRRFGDMARDQAAAVATDSMGFTIVAGTFDGQLKVNFDNTLESMASTQDAFLLRLGPSGNGFAGISMQADDSAQAEGVAVDPTDDSIVVVGRVRGSVDFGAGPQSGNDDMFVAKFAP